MQDQKQHFFKTKVLSVILGCIGFVTSLYALYLHIQILLSPHQGRFCDIDKQINCSGVIGSKFGEIASIPLGAFGMSYFAMVIIASLGAIKETKTEKTNALIQFYLALTGVIAVLFLGYLSYIKIGILCPVCSLTHLITILYFLLQLFYFLGTRKTKKGEKTSPFIIQKFIIYSLFFAIPPLVAGLFTPILATVAR